MRSSSAKGRKEGRRSVRPRRGRSADGSPAFVRPFRKNERVGEAYKIGNVLGHGGFGTVYEAYDEVLQRRVALKTTAQPEAELRSEARALAAFRHPGVVSVYGFGTHEGHPYIVMERVFGKTLEAHLAARFAAGAKISVVEAIELSLAIAEVLAAIHAHGLVHRDLKPANVMLTPNGRLVVMDFGTFRTVHSSEPELVGTLQYMAPEALSRTRVSPAVDVFALGMTMYEMLAGAVPFDTVVKFISFTEHKLALPPLRDARPDVPSQLAGLVHEMLDLDPTRRPDSPSVAFRLRAAREDLRQQAATRPLRILIVDDEPALCRLLRTWLSKSVTDCHIECANNGEEALRMVHREPPEVLILDLCMPNMSGMELAMHLRAMKSTRDCMIVSVSAAANEHDVDLLRHLGITRFVPKGETFLRQVLEHVLAQQRLLAQARAGA